MDDIHAVSTEIKYSNHVEYYSDDVEYFCPEPTFDWATFSATCFTVIFILSVIGNSLMSYLLISGKDLKNITNLFVLNLACSDLIFTLTLPFWAVHELYHWLFGEVLCKLTTALFFIGQHSSIILLTAITVDRYVTVVLHNQVINHARRMRWAMAACAAAWVISTGASVSDAMKVKLETQWNNHSICKDPSEGTEVTVGYYLQVSLLFFVPFVIMVFCYSAILRTVLQASNRKRYRTVVVVFCIVAAFFLCWGPYNILIFVSTFYKPEGCSATARWFTAFAVCRILAFSHCFMNPLLYMFSQNMRNNLLQLFRCKKKETNVRERGTVQSTSVML